MPTRERNAWRSMPVFITCGACQTTVRVEYKTSGHSGEYRVETHTGHAVAFPDPNDATSVITPSTKGIAASVMVEAKR